MSSLETKLVQNNSEVQMFLLQHNKKGHHNIVEGEDDINDDDKILGNKIEIVGIVADVVLSNICSYS